MIKSFKSRTLKRFWTKNQQGAVAPEFRAQIRFLLSLLDGARHPFDMNVPSTGFHPLGYDRKGTYALTVSRNWRITFEFEGEHAVDVDLEDYHGDD